jgi:hypothetical protein
LSKFPHFPDFDLYRSSRFGALPAPDDALQALVLWMPGTSRRSLSLNGSEVARLVLRKDETAPRRAWWQAFMRTFRSVVASQRRAARPL